jgi:hypothetical protein
VWLFWTEFACGIAIAQPFPVLEIRPRRESPRPDLRGDGDGQLQRPPVRRALAALRDRGQSVDKQSLLIGRRGFIDDCQEIQVAVRLQSTRDGGAGEVQREEPVAEGVGDDFLGSSQLSRFRPYGSLHQAQSGDQNAPQTSGCSPVWPLVIVLW